MASSALEAKINKIRQQNEEIRRRYEEVEEDKKNAAKLNALVQMVPSSDWPERKEPPEFSNPPKVKQKPTKEKHEHVSHPHPVEGKKFRESFAQGEGPPPDPKYNFLADSEREEPSVEYAKESAGNRTHNKVTRGSFRKKTNDREITMKNNKIHKVNYKDESQPGYDAWRAERNRIDEDRISRQRTAEGNWRREWDNDKIHIIDDAQNSSRPILGNFIKKDYKDSDRRYYANNNEHVNHSRGGSRPHRGTSKNFYGNYDNRSHNTYDQHRNNAVMPTKTPLSPSSEERTVVATDKSIKVTVNQANVTKGPMMSVKAGTGRVGPRQRTRVTYSHSDAEAIMSEGEPFHRQKSFEDKSKGTYYNNQKSPNVKRSHLQKKKEGDPKYPYHQRKETKKEDSDVYSHKHHENEFRSYGTRDSQKFHSNKSPKPMRGNVKAANEDSSMDTSEKHETRENTNTDSTEVEDNAISEPLPSNQAEMLNAENEDIIVDSSEKHETPEFSNPDTTKVENNAISEPIPSNQAEMSNAVDETSSMNPSEKSETEECSNTDSAKVENNVIENNEISELDPSDQAESCNTEKKEVNTSEITNETRLKKEETSLTSLSGPENSESTTKEETDKSSLDKSECTQELANDAKQDLQGSSDKSSEVLVPTAIDSKEELVPNESNNVPDDIDKLEEAPLSTDDQQSVKQVSEQLENDDCDNIKDEVTEQRSTQATTNEHVSSLEVETQSVIEVKGLG
ncbi:uncharacterized protein LOC143177068 isoform X2 [Calliopsis andreniformis]|uniref:uncharacterized protein LOC143177068 isoform X2 n=1 Tax=Calliopsis andreniformis TaxID=337506 RepID=UPI003FCCAACE